jgi:hypothetical protein
MASMRGWTATFLRELPQSTGVAEHERASESTYAGLQQVILEGDWIKVVIGQHLLQLTIQCHNLYSIIMVRKNYDFCLARTTRYPAPSLPL